MEWAGLVDLSKFTVAAAAYGGPIGNSLLIYVITIAVCVACCAPWGDGVAQLVERWTKDFNQNPSLKPIRSVTNFLIVFPSKKLSRKRQDK